MAISNPRQSRRIKGFLCADPTDLSTPFPHGGTALGMVADILFQTRVLHAPVTAEEFGGEPVEWIGGGEVAVLGCIARGMDNDMLQKIFLNTTVGSSSGSRVVSNPGTKRAGSLRSSDSFVLLFSPKDTTRHRGILVYNAVPMLDESAELQLSINEEIGIACLFQGIRDSSDRIYSMARLEDLTL